MSFSSELAEIRFGCGLSPVVGAPRSPQDVFDRLQLADTMATRFPIEPFDTFRARQLAYGQVKRQERKAKKNNDHDEEARLKEVAGTMRRDGRAAKIGWLGQSLLRWTWSEQGFYERLVSFWADHFTARGKAAMLQYAAPTYIEEAIRPNVTGRFSDLLIATTTHPIMLHYLDQDKSFGPNSQVVKKRKKDTGLNENLAREVLELHTLGVDGPYEQADVRQLAELFTGLTQNPKVGFVFRKQMAEPGAETVLGREYGGDPSLEAIHQALTDLALHPATARYIATKLVVHFVSDQPDRALVEHLTARYQQTGGDLMQVYAALLEHSASWSATLSNVKPPFSYVASACRALAVPANRLEDVKPRRIARGVMAPLAVMGQVWLTPGGPDGWPEEDSAWITPQGLAARMRWAMAAPSTLLTDLPDPRQFQQDALGRYATAEVQFAAQSAETRAEAIGLVLISPSFQRR